MTIPASTPPERLTPPGSQPTAEEVLGALPGGVLVLDEHGVIRRVNQQAARWCGATPEALLGRSLAEADLPEALEARLRQLLEPGEHPAREVFLPAQQQWVAFSGTRQARGWVVYGQQVSAPQLPAVPLPALTYAPTEGYCVLEVLFDEAGEQPLDFRYLELDPVFIRQSGLPKNSQGRTARELLPDLAPFWFDTYGRVARTGEAVRVEHYAAAVSRWFDVHAFRVGPPEARQVAVLFNDITARKHTEAALRASEQQQAFLLGLSDALRPLTDPVEIQGTAARILGEYLGVERAYYVDLNYVTREFVVARDWHQPGAPTPARRSPLGAWPMPWLLDGRTWVCPDVDTDPTLPDEERPLYRSNAIRAAVVVPLVKQGQLAATLVVNQDVPRAWQPQEVLLVEKVAERTWAAVQRAHAEEALAYSEEKYRSLFTSLYEGYAVVEVLADKQGTWTDFRFLETNPAFENYTGMRQAVGRTASQILGRPDPAGASLYGHVATTGQPARFEQYEEALGRTFDISTFRLGGEGSRRLAVVFADITERKHRERRQAFLLGLSDVLRTMTTPAQLQIETMRALGEQFGAVRAQYWEAEADGSHFCSEGGYAPQGPLPAGRIRASDFSTPSREAFAAGRTVALADVAATPLLSGPVPAAYQVADGRSCLAIPLVKGGQLVAVLIMHRAEVHQWTQEEISLAEEVAERTWAAVARARAAEAVVRSEEQMRLALRVGNMLSWEVDMATGQSKVSDTYAEVTGAPPVEPEADALPSIVRYCVPEDRDKLQADLTRTMRGEGAMHGEYRFQLPALDYVDWYAVHARLFQNPGGVPGRVVGVARKITPRKQAQEALRLSQERLLLALQAGRMGSFEWQPKGDRLTLSATSEEIFGLRPGTAVRSSNAGFGLVHPDDRARHQALFEEAGRLGQDFHSIYRIVRPRDGAVRWIEERGQARPDPATGLTCLRGVHWDVTEQVQAQQHLAGFNAKLEQRVARRTQELQASRDLLRSVFDTNLIAMSVMKAVRDETGAVQNFRLQLVNKELERETGRPDLVGKLYAEEYPGIREAGIFNLAVRALETGEPQGMDYYYPHEGFDKWFACQFVKLDDGVVGINLDITERKLAEQERTRNLRLLEQAEAVAGLGSWDYDLATGTMYWSDGMYHLLGRPPGSTVTPHTYLEMVLDEDRARAGQLVHQLSTGQGLEETLRLHVLDQVKTVRIKAVALPNEQGQPNRVLGVDLDISQLQRLEQDNLRLRLRQQQALFEAVQAAQEAERKRIAESLHNGIGQLLYATKLRLDQLHAPVLDTAPALVATRQEADRLLADAIRQTRLLSHELVPLVLEEFGLVAALQDISRKMSSSQLSLHCQVLLDEEAPPITPALQVALYRMAQELSQNIVKHARGATVASLEIETTPGWVMLRAEDNGPGFAKNQPPTTGLGLRSIHDRVRLLGGAMETGTSGGAYVRIRLPLSRPL